MIRAAARRLRLLLLAAVVHLLAAVVRLRRRVRAPRTAPGPIAVIGAYGNGNYGDDAIGLGIADTLADLGRTVRFLGREPDGSRLREATDEPYRALGGGLGGVRRARSASRGCGAAVLGGGGLLEGDPENVHVQRLVLEYVGKLLVAGLRGRPIVVHGVGVCPDLYSRRSVTSAVLHALRAVDGIAVRDVRSRDALAAAGIDAALVRDPALALLARWAADAPARPGVVAFVGLDRARWPTFAPGSPQAERTRREAIAGIVAELDALSTGASTLELLPFHASDPPFLEAVRDAVLAAPFAATLDVRPVGDYPLTSAREAFRGLIGAERVLTMRFHPALAVLAAGRRVEIVGGLQKLAALRAVATGTPTVMPPEFADPDAVLRGWLEPERPAG